jgi:hypothetical protein
MTLGLLLAGLTAPGVAPAQGTLDSAAARARGDWLAHDIAALLTGSDTVRLQLPGVARSASLTPGQAARLLLRYVEGSDEAGFDLRHIRSAAPDHGYAEARRRYVVRGTTDQREETVFLGFRLVDRAWRLREVRVVP